MPGARCSAISTTFATQPTSLRDTTEAYGPVTRLLHWAIAALILWQFLGMGLRLVLGRTPLVSFFVGAHQPVGAVLFVLIVARVIWALANRGRRPAHGIGAVALAARAGHGALYALMLAVPVAALLRAWGNTRAFEPWGVPVFPARETPVEWAVTLGDLLHGEMAWVLAALVLGHILMVMVHESFWRDGTLARMAGRRGAVAPSPHPVD